jgi:hypothetical protein
VVPPNVEVMRWSEAGEMSVSGYVDSSARYEGSRAPYFFSRYGEASSTLPDSVFGNTLVKRTASAPLDGHGQGLVGRQLAGAHAPQPRRSDRSRPSISSWSVALKHGSV